MFQPSNSEGWITRAACLRSSASSPCGIFPRTKTLPYQSKLSNSLQGCIERAILGIAWFERHLHSESSFAWGVRKRKNEGAKALGFFREE